MLKERHGILILALSALVIVDGFCARLKFALRYFVKTLVVLKTLAALIAKMNFFNLPYRAMTVCPATARMTRETFSWQQSLGNPMFALAVSAWMG